MNQFLSAARQHLASAGSVPIALQRVARAAVPCAADFCLIFLAKNDDVPCVASAHCTDDGRRLLRRLNRSYKITRNDPASTVAHVLRCGRPQLRSEIVDEPHAPIAHARVLSLHRRLGARSALVVPIGARPNVLGAMSLCFTDSGRRYSAGHIRAARRVAGLIAAFVRARAARARRARAQVPLSTRRRIPLRARV